MAQAGRVLEPSMGAWVMQGGKVEAQGGGREGEGCGDSEGEGRGRGCCCRHMPRGDGCLLRKGGKSGGGLHCGTGCRMSGYTCFCGEEGLLGQGLSLVCLWRTKDTWDGFNMPSLYGSTEGFVLGK